MEVFVATFRIHWVEKSLKQNTACCALRNLLVFTSNGSRLEDVQTVSSITGERYLPLLPIRSHHLSLQIA